MRVEDRIWYGGDYNPDQWPEEIWEKDFELFKKAGVTMITLPVFSWSRIQKDEDSFDFEWLLTILKKAEDSGIGVCLATSTAVQPAWLSKKYPSILPVDSHGIQKRFGGRVKFCPNSSHYKEAARKLVTNMVNAVSDFDNIVMWHIGNEYDNYCYCDTCRRSFQHWVKDKYKTIENVNQKWYLNFWGHQVYDFDEIEIPDYRSENWEMAGLERTNFQTILLDYKRFMDESILNCYLNELEVIRTYSKDIPVTTNFMGAFKPLNYFKWAKYLDYISWDHYPGLNEPTYKGAMAHDLMRSLKKDKPFWLMEQSPSQQNWSPYNTLKRPGTLRLQTYQTMARGADAIMFFQMRRSLANCEKFHGALIDHFGDEQTRVFKECAVIGTELAGLSEVIGSQVKARVGIVFDWENWWAIEMSSGPSIDIRYMDIIDNFYKAVHKQNEMVDFIWEEDDLSRYDVVFAPMLYLTTDKMYEKLEGFVSRGGQLVLTTFSGIVDANDRVTTKGYPGLFREMAGIWVEEIDGLLPEMTNDIVGFNEKTYSCHLLCDLIHAEGAEILATYGKEFYKGTPVVTKNNYKKGEVYYLGSIPDEFFMDEFMKRFIQNTKLSKSIEKSTRYKKNIAYEFYINYGESCETIELDGQYVDLITKNIFDLQCQLKEKDAVILKKL